MPNLFKNCKVVGRNITYEVYHRQGKGVERGHRDFSMSRGELKAFYACPEKWLCGVEDSAMTDSTEWGTWMDIRLLGDVKSFAVTPETYPDTKSGEPKPWNWNANYCKDWRKEHDGALIVKPDEWARIDEAAERLLEDGELGELVRCSQKQIMVVGEYADKATKLTVPVRTLIDLVPDSKHPTFGKCLADLKTTQFALPFVWSRKVFDYWYHVQAAMNLDLYTAATGEDRCDFRHAVQESHAPFQPGHEVLSQDFIELGRAQLHAALAWYCHCLAAGQWPNYAMMQPAEQRIGAWSLCTPAPWMVLTLAEKDSPPAISKPAEEYADVPS